MNFSSGLHLSLRLSLRLLLLPVTFLVFQFTAAGGGESDHLLPASQGHAPNDYLHERPLLDALENGFSSV